ncbi:MULTISPECIES: DUF5309 family protein [Sinorhizobium]|uniref:SU10 major capsid protein n=1 Tax=Sinorhizobium TaxID=28105 RepID=UPI000FD9C71E|nr:MULTISPECIES: DUF5309 family protein [Sinorhizobium]RVK19425.1 head protein [Sinorhizobium medicae]RVO54944.1 head protein [Sinorhizobium meliloti]
MAPLITNQIKHSREDLVQGITTVEPQETPFFSSIGKTKARNTRHEYVLGALDAPNADNAQIEGAVAPDTVPAATVRHSNICQIFARDVRVSGTLQAVDTAAAKSEKARLTADKALEIRRDIEAAMLSARGSVDSEPRKMAGVQGICSTNASVGDTGAVAGYSGGLYANPVAGTARPLTEDMFLDHLQQIWTGGGRPSEVLAGPVLKKKISTFTGGNSRQQMADKKTVTQGVDIYVSDWGTFNVTPHPYALTTTVFIYDPKMWKAAFLRQFENKELGHDRDAELSAIYAEVTLEAKNEKTSGQIRDLNG